jgi:hypothetical protein
MKNNFASSLAGGFNCKELQSAALDMPLDWTWSPQNNYPISGSLTLGVVIPRTLWLRGSYPYTLNVSTFN